MAFRLSSRIFADTKGYAQNLCTKIFSWKVTSPTLLKLSRPGIVCLNQTRAAGSDAKVYSPLREYFSREIKFHNEELNCNSVADLPKYKGFKLRLNDDGTAVFEQTHKNETITVEVDANIRGFATDERNSTSSSSDSDISDEEYDSDEDYDSDEEYDSDECDDNDVYDDDEETSDEMIPQFDVKIKKSAEEICFSCTYKTAEVLNNMTEEDIYDITSIGISSSDLTVDAIDLSEDLLSLYYGYLKERGITQEFLLFLESNFLPVYEQFYYVEKVLKPLANFT